MAEEHRPLGPEASMVAALDDAAATLLSVWEETRERTTNRLSTAQLRAVVVVEQHDGINLRRLATLLGMLLSSASRLCDRLVAAGMLEREPGRYDRREISLHLTPEAMRLLAELRAERQARLAEVLAGMSQAGREALRRGLAEFQEVARRSPPAEPPPPSAGPPDPRRPGDGPHQHPTGPPERSSGAPAEPGPAYQPPTPSATREPRPVIDQRGPSSAFRAPASGPGPARSPLVALPPPTSPTARPA
ncbi:MarR family winged helix-turn-helix transcriptional regulator [Micromonospora sagamiensis]|uniref:MarR family winged helix-turn-helix transcriptional regulator n=1 Tax=Micromonospora sagamiensis TaxID=47875 RepID=UPI001E30D4B4|nr:MarR family transcriptional regulator [Micromonospora sagamiensis]